MRLKKLTRLAVVTVSGITIIVVFFCLPGWLWTVAVRQDWPLARVLFTHNIGLNSAYGAGLTPLGMAIDKGNMDLVRSLIERGADVNRQFNTHDGAWTPLGFAIYKSDFEAAKLLINKGADPEKGADLGQVTAKFSKISGTKTLQIDLTPLGLAIDKGNTDLVRYLIEKGADVNRRFHTYDRKATPLGFVDGQWTPLGLAIYNNDFEALKLLLAKGADPNIEYTLYYKSHSNKISIITDLTENTPLMHACALGRKNMIVLLLNSGANINAVAQGRTPLLLACNSKLSVDMVNLLIDRGADINANLPYGTPLANAICANRPELAKLLLERGANINAQEKNILGRTLLMIALDMGDSDTARLFIDQGVDVNVKDAYGRTAIMYAAAYDNLEILNLLLKRGAEVTAKTNDGDTVLEFAYKYSKGKKAVPIIRRYMAKENLSPGI